MNKKEYVIAQLGRAKNKKYESYVVNRIIHLLNDFDIKFVTQQYVSRNENSRALTDLFFPQFNVHIEVDEGQHFNQINIEKDKIREADIVNATGHRVWRIDVTKTLDYINDEINKIVTEIKRLKSENIDKFQAWDINAEFNPETYIKKGYIDIVDNVSFKTISDACNCFGHNYRGYQRAGARHSNESEVLLWFPKLFLNADWDNSISSDESIIIEKNLNPERTSRHVQRIKNDPSREKHQRIVFAKVKGNLGDVLYRFRGLYKLDLQKSNETDGLVWKRIASKVKTYPHSV